MIVQQSLTEPRRGQAGSLSKLSVVQSLLPQKHNLAKVANLHKSSYLPANSVSTIYANCYQAVQSEGIGSKRSSLMKGARTVAIVVQAQYDDEKASA